MNTETQEFWCRGYCIDTVIKNTKAITQYIKNQLENDRMTDQLALFDPKDPFSKGQLVTDATLAGTNMHIYVQLIVLGLCPKMKYHQPGCWIFISGRTSLCRQCLCGVVIYCDAKGRQGWHHDV